MKDFGKFDSELFNSINELDERAIVLAELGKHVHTRFEGKYKIKIYALFEFYVEVWVNIKKREVYEIHALETNAEWEGYMKSIDLNDYY